MENQQKALMSAEQIIQIIHDACQLIGGWKATTPRNEWSEFDETSYNNLASLLSAIPEQTAALQKELNIIAENYDLANNAVLNLSSEIAEVHATNKTLRELIDTRKEFTKKLALSIGIEDKDDYSLYDVYERVEKELTDLNKYNLTLKKSAVLLKSEVESLTGLVDGALKEMRKKDAEIDALKEAIIKGSNLNFVIKWDGKKSLKEIAEDKYQELKAQYDEVKKSNEQFDVDNAEIIDKYEELKASADKLFERYIILSKVAPTDFIIQMAIKQTIYEYESLNKQEK